MQETVENEWEWRERVWKDKEMTKKETIICLRSKRKGQLKMLVSKGKMELRMVKEETKWNAETELKASVKRMMVRSRWSSQERARKRRRKEEMMRRKEVEMKKRKKMSNN